MSCGQNIENVRLSNIKVSPANERTTYLYGASRGVRSRGKESGQAAEAVAEIPVL